VDAKDDSVVITSAEDASFRAAIDAARGGDRERIGQVLESCRDSLLLAAARGIGPDLGAKGSASDMVQETLFGAYRDFATFHGRTREELIAWLYKILSNNLAVFRRRYRGTEKRTVAREIPIGQTSSHERAANLRDSAATPATVAQRREQTEVILAALGRLRAEHRRVIVWRQYDQLTFEEIGRRLDRSAEAARKVWSRALMALTQELKGANGPQS